MFRLTLSNRVEYLLDRLLESLTSEQADVLAPRHVIVPSAAIRRRVELAYADQSGICANVAFSFLAQWLWARLAQVVPVQEQSPFSPKRLSWRIYELFGDATFGDNHPRLAHYLKQADPVMRLDLAMRVATLLEHYITYRPEWLAAWSDGDSLVGAAQGLPAHLSADACADEAWQAALWRRITHDLGIQHQHPSVAFFEKIAAVGYHAAEQYGLPTVAHVFCLPAIPPLYLDILRRLSHWMDVQVYALNPCREYWFEIIDPKRLRNETIRTSAHHAEQHFHEVGNTLLASWGKQTQAHLGLLLFAEEGELIEEESLFIADDRTTLLARVQNAILDMVELAPGSITLDDLDRSIEIHICHSLTRELEVLHDRLLDLLASDDPPLPQEILVVTPHLEDAAFVIDRVFGTAPVARRIPYTITGQPQTRINPVAHVLDSLLALGSGRFLASAVFALLQQEPVAEQYQLTCAGLEQIHDWMQQAGICWGWDGQQRAALGLPETERHSFSEGMNRLFLSYALGERATDTILHNYLPAGNPEGLDAIFLGRFWRFLERVNHLRQEWARPLLPEEWQYSLNRALGDFIPDSLLWVDDLRAVRAAIGRLYRNMVEGGSCSALPLALVRQVLANELDDPIRGGIPTGTVTFSSINSLRGLSYRVICMVGMEDAAFPGSQHAAEFDLMAIAPRRCDRQHRTDGRNLFLDLLLAARDYLHISYCGRSIRDNGLLPPSVLVAELLDSLASAIAVPDASGEIREDAILHARSRLTVHHPLQAFSLAYFTAGQEKDTRLHSYHAEFYTALHQKLLLEQSHERQTTAPLVRTLPEESEDEEAEAGDTDQDDRCMAFFTAPLTAPPEELRVVTNDQLERFYRNPCRILLRERLGITLAGAEELLQDDEPFLSDYPRRQAMAQRLLPTLLQRNRAVAPTNLLDLALAGTEFPSGLLGRRLAEGELEHLQRFAERLAPVFSEPTLTPLHQRLTFEIAGECWQLNYTLADVRESSLVRYRYDDTRPVDYLAGWIAHLCLCSAQAESLIQMRHRQTTWHSRNGFFSFRPCENAREELQKLLGGYRQGLMQPLYFFPKSAWAYCISGQIEKARKKWHDAYHPERGENADPSYQLALRGVENPLDGDFCKWANTVLGPLLQHVEDDRGLVS